MAIHNIIGTFSVPTVLFAVGLLLLFSKRELFSEFIKGATEGVKTCLELFPTLVILMTAVGMFSASGALDGIVRILTPLLSNIGLPSEILPTLVIRPLSGSAANATVNKLLFESGPDSFAGRCISIVMGSSDTIIYTLAVYFGAVGIRKTRHAYPAAFLTYAFCTVLSSFLARVFFVY